MSIVFKKYKCRCSSNSLFSIEINSIVNFSNIQLLANALSTLIAFGNKTVEQVLNEFLDAKLVRFFLLLNHHFMMNFNYLGYD